MDDCCAVCAEPLEWVAYGPCLHRDVCSTCVARLRFICDDRHCCICKTDCNVVFVTKALGDYTRMINDFSALPSTVREGKAGSYWYHEDTNAYFDDMDHYKMIKAMCRLSCSVCDKIEEQPHDASRRRERFRNIGQLKGHLFHRHKLHMCTLCLEGRKVFICEQKLYSRAQLNQHINTGDSLVDGSESERGGFMGHPMCEFCRTPFYGDNELYTHMSTEHYTCHICQRQHPGQYEYYKNYDDLEIHFRQQHFLCEDEACLAKKFVVFQSEAEMKRHNTTEHGGRMSRSRRHAALQIPTSFRYRHGNEQNQQRRGRARTFSRDMSENQLSMAIEASLETANAEQMFHDSSTSSSGQAGVDDGNADVDSIVPPFESLATSGSEQSSRYLQALGHSSRGAPLQDSSFPPLATPSINDQQSSKNELETSSINTMAARLRRHGNRNVSVINSGNAWPAAGRGLVQTSIIPTQSKLSTNVAPGVSANSGQVKTEIKSGASPSTYASSIQVTQRTGHGQWPAGSLQEKCDNGRTVHSISAPNLTKSNPIEGSISEFPPISAAQVSKLPASSQSQLNVEDVHSANKSLVERIRGALDFDEDRYTLFKDISAQFRQSTIDTDTYLDYVQQFGLSHLVLEMARLCPDPQKQKELIESYNASLQRNALQENSRVHDITSTHAKDSNISKKGKGKSVDARGSNSTERLADSFLNTVHQLQSSYKPSEENSEVLSRGDYRTNKGKLKIEQPINTNSGNQPIMKLNGQGETSSRSLPNQNREYRGGRSKQRKKASEFLKVRLGDGSVSALLDRENSYTESDPGITNGLDGDKNGSGGLPARGVWQKGGAQKLFS
ncbi:putative transcription factor interactor and regulator LIM family [Lupinus albus]|uniref:RING-type E3 ubiquitin transferase n=1 Tax=Lupinus albus TaxID=3870 RepID=A0A6A4P062_LUPAL|nr:putative transcription factor interactor and regulator LIM family [Lupinus albus]